MRLEIARLARPFKILAKNNKTLRQSRSYLTSRDAQLWPLFGRARFFSKQLRAI